MWRGYGAQCANTDKRSADGLLDFSQSVSVCVCLMKAQTSRTVPTHCGFLHTRRDNRANDDGNETIRLNSVYVAHAGCSLKCAADKLKYIMRGAYSGAR